MRLTFHGGAGEVGKSLMQLEAEGRSMVFDCGIKLSEEHTAFPPLPKRADAVFISHAHLDHSGMTPALWKQEPVAIYATDVTFEIAHLLQLDSVKIAKKNKEFLPYKAGHVERMQSSEISLDYNRPRTIFGSVGVELFDAGHIPGSASIAVEAEDKRIVYTGDVNYQETLLQSPGKLPKSDVLIIESTYGDRNHPPREETRQAFLADIEATLDRGGVALLPAFAVGRSQEILMLLAEADLGYPVYFDGMGQTMTRMFLQNSQYLRDADALSAAAKNTTFIRHHAQRKKITKKPCIIVTTAGMLEGGPVMTYLQRLADDRKSSVILSGYQVEGTNGRKLVEKGYIHDEYENKVPIHMDIKQYDFSAHADQSHLLAAIEKSDPDTVACMHGDPAVIDVFAEKIRETGRDALTPVLGETIDL